MLDPRDREIFACRTCRDFGFVYDGPTTVECPECSAWPPDKKHELLRAATRQTAEKPEISMADLTPDERALMAEWVVAHPHVHELTLLTWIEGRRYDPSKDPDFLSVARKKFKKWRFLRYASVEGPTPDWVKHCMKTGEVSHLPEHDRQYILELKASQEDRT